MALVLAVLILPSKATENHAQSTNRTAEEAIQFAKEQGWTDYDEKALADRVAQYEGEALEAAKRAEQYLNQSVNPTINEQLSFQDAVTLGDLNVPLAMDVPKATDLEAEDCNDSANTEGWMMFISSSMSSSELGRAIRYARDRDMPIYLRGFIEADSPVAATFKAMMQVVSDYGDDVKIGLHPDEFKAFSINRVPAIAYRDGQKQWVVRGLYSKEWLSEQIELHPDEQGKDFGVIGKVYDIAEPDAKLLMQQRLANYDFERAKKRAIKRFWASHGEFSNLPKAKKHKQWYIDPTVRLNADIKRGDQVLGRKGQIINPIKDANYPLTLLVFDPSNRHQLQWALDTIPTLGYRKIMPIATHIDKRNGSKQLDSLTQRFGMQVYLLKKDLKDRFFVQQTPTVIQTKEAYFHVMEIGNEWLVDNKGLPTL
ncbi:hypothetical protein IC617_08100 [Neiella sp. HB171785]|uniref:Conjugal transfer protein n=1 Tax=Neiella litorisoli TaxID=2771431 RepID=A0A8J6ULQ6_9GAMM|nr:TrbC family F-type conjugative pilus assembly protein [Neiella litorisoli]MBD1389385.1 hypothetical protein [Neiella litorisoli]